MIPQLQLENNLKSLVNTLGLPSIYKENFGIPPDYWMQQIFFGIQIKFDPAENVD